MFYEHVMCHIILGKKTLIRFDLYIYTNLNVTWSNLETIRKGRNLRVTSHTRLRARDHYISSTLIGGKCGAGPSSLHPMLEGPLKYVNARCKYKQTLNIMFSVHLPYYLHRSLDTF